MTSDVKMTPLLTRDVHESMRAAGRGGRNSIEVTLDLGRSTTAVAVAPDAWCWRGQRFAYLAKCRDHTIYHWNGHAFEPVARFGARLVKLVPTPFGAPTFEVDGIKMLPTANGSPYADAQRKVDLIAPRGKVVLDTCAGLGYFAAWCLARGARQVLSYEKNADVIWLRELNPWSPAAEDRLELVCADVVAAIETLPERSVEAVLHDPPRFGTAGELYSAAFYEQLARVLMRKGRLFHYTGEPNRLTSARNVPAEVARRLQGAGFAVERVGDGLIAVRR